MLALFALLLAAPAGAAEPLDSRSAVDLGAESDLQFGLGIDAYQAGRYEEALAHLLASHRLAPNKAVVFNIARSWEKLGDYAQAWRYYAAYTAMETDPERRAAAERAQAALAGRVALVRIESDPPGATVYVDREDLGARGVTPEILALPPGPHLVLLRREGYEPASQAVEAAIGATVEARAPLERILGTVRVTGTAGATVRLDTDDGPVLGTIPGDLRIPPGKVILVVSAPGHATARVPADVVADATVRAVAELELLTGTLVVDAFERDALIEVDGVAAGFTPAVLELPVGPHAVAVSLPGFRRFETEVEIEAEATDSVEARLESLQEVTAASRTTETLEDAPASVSVITAEEIRAFGYTTVYDALAATRGIFQNDDLAYQSLGIRGFNRLGDYGNRTLVTWDGHTINDDQLTGSGVGEGLTPDLHDVERVELVRGPGSALYGTNAFFGVINVVTTDAPPGAHAVVTGDSNRTVRARVGWGTGDATRGVYLSAAQLASPGDDYYFEELDTDRRSGDIEGADHLAASTMHLKTWTGDLTVQTYYSMRYKRFPTGAYGTVPGSPAAKNEDHRSFTEVRYEPRLGDKAQFYGRAYFDQYRYYGDFPYRGGYLYSDRWLGLWAGAEPRLVLTPSPAVTATLGAEAKLYPYAALDSTDSDGLVLNADRPTQQIWSGYAILQLDPWKSVTLTGGGRYDWFSLQDIGGTFNPRVTLVLRPSDRDVVKLLGGTAFRAPSPYELFYDDTGITQIEADGIRPERIRTVELEASHRFDDVLVLTGSLWNYHMPGLVDLTLTQEGLLQYANNDARVDGIGGEYELRRDWRRGTMFAVQHSIARVREGGFVDGERVMNSPAHLMSLKAAVPAVAGSTTIASRVRVGSPRLTTTGGETPWAVIWDLNVTGTLPTVPITWAAGVRNLLDWKELHPGGVELAMPALPQPGRELFLSVEVRPWRKDLRGR